ncbi:unnamed protein product [Psylliodes chrysocephalus]|uniref:SIAH-type domain-containing protein n=1 Tax=Psylliodes chrysocephalus TaxID=3402493 RepID=A0A9P0CR39_9CUCU|nr:unnamed protein product [Psylliodes chrysocephala]
MFILSDEVLDKLLCSACFEYLSVRPVKIYRRGVIKCGRCSDDKDDGIVSMYENLIVNGLFPCINRYEGCTQLLAYSEVAAHEKDCSSSCYSCPICSSQFTSYHFVRHYKNDHSNAVLEKPEIILTKQREYENYYLYKENDFIFILYARCNLAEKCFFLNAACLGRLERVGRIKQYVKCYLGNFKDTLFLQTRKRDCSLIDNNSESFKVPFPDNTNLISISFHFDKTGVNILNCISNNAIVRVGNESGCTTDIVGLHNEYPKMFLSEEYKRQYPNHYLSPCGTKLLIKENNIVKEFPRICEFCENIFPISISSTLFRCECNHVFCSICFAIEPSCCNTKVTQLKPSHFESKIYRSLYFYCRWNCARFYCGTDLRYHEDHCKENVDAQDLPSTLALRHFNFYLSDAKSHSVSRSNIFSFKQYNFMNRQKIFVITRDYFKFVLHSSFENKMFHFWVSHDYPGDKYYILFKIRDKFVDYFRVNTFSIDNAHNNILAFAVLLRKIV